jgi:hypothetical protein
MLALPNFVSTNLVIAKSKVVVLKFNKDQFYELVADNVKLADRVLNSFEMSFKKFSSLPGDFLQPSSTSPMISAGVPASGSKFN